MTSEEAPGPSPSPGGEDPPALRDALQLTLAAILEGDARAGTDLDAERRDGIGQRHRAPDGAGRRLEGREEAVPGRLDLAPPKALQLGADEPVVLVEEIPPPPVAHRGGEGRGLDDVGEQQRGEDAIWIGARASSREELLDLVHEPVEPLGVSKVVRAR